MHFLHYSLNLGARDVVQVKLESHAYVRLIDDENYKLYRSGRNYKYFGGLTEQSPAIIKPPIKGPWHLCIDRGGGEGDLTASVHIIQEVAPDENQRKGRRRKKK